MAAEVHSAVATLDLALWLALLPFLAGLTVAEALTDRMPAMLVVMGCAVSLAGVLWTADVASRLAGGLVLAGMGTALGYVQLLGRRAAERPAAAGPGRPAPPRWWLEPLAALCAGLVAGWGAAWSIGVTWLAIAGAVAFFLAITGRTADLKRISFVPFLTLGVILVFLLQLVPFS